MSRLADFAEKVRSRIHRRDWLNLMLAGLAPAPALASAQLDDNFVTFDLTLPGDGKFVRRARLFVDKRTSPDRLLILLHGRGEADSVVLALRAWSHLYGLLDAYNRLQNPPVGAVFKEPRWETERAAAINASLAQDAFKGFAVLCPVTPNPAAFGRRETLYEAYTDWLTNELVPAVRTRQPNLGARIGLDGCSMGGALALELFLLRPDFFRSFGTVQAAIGADRADALAERFRAAKSAQKLPRIHLLTSTTDPYRQANERLNQQLLAANVDGELEVLHGPHNQVWLRQMGTLAMLFWHDRQL